MRLARVVGNYALTELPEDGVERRRLFGRDRVEQLPRGLAIECGEGRLVAERGQVFSDEIGHLTADALHRGVVQLER